MSQTSRDRVNSRLVRTHEKNSGETVRRLGTIIQTIFCAQSGRSICFTFWKWSGESRYPGALPPLLENFRRAFSPGPTDFLALFISNLHYKKKRPTTDSRKQGCVITIVLDFNNNNALIVNHSICTYRQDAIQYSLSVIEVIIHIFN